MKFSKLLMPKYTDNRHARAIKVALNKHYGNHSALNKELATLIASFSHRANIANGSYLMSSDLRFFVVQRLLSNHWCLGWFCPSKLALVRSDVRYVPDFMHRGQVVRKRINDPFSTNPSVNIRKKIYFLQKPTPKPYNSYRLFSEIIGNLF